MRYYIGIILNQKNNFSVRKVVGEVGEIFQDNDNSVKWVHPNVFRIDLLDIGCCLNIFDKYIINYKINNFKYRPFNAITQNVVLGKKRLYKGLIYLDFIEGGDDLRNLFFIIKRIVKKSFNDFFIPNISIGRVNEDLSSEQISNIDISLRLFNKASDTKCISFIIDKIYLYRIEEDRIEIISVYSFD